MQQGTKKALSIGDLPEEGASNSCSETKPARIVSQLLISASIAKEGVSCSSGEHWKEFLSSWHSKP